MAQKIAPVSLPMPSAPSRWIMLAALVSPLQASSPRRRPCGFLPHASSLALRGAQLAALRFNAERPLCPRRAIRPPTQRSIRRGRASRLRAASGSIGVGTAEPWHCQRLREEHLDAACALDVLSYGGKGLWTRDMYRADIASPGAEVIGLFTDGSAVADCSGSAHERAALVGMASVGVVAGEASITSMAVLPTERGHGLGEALMVGLMLICAARKAEAMFLEVRADSNAPAIALYRKAGSAPCCPSSLPIPSQTQIVGQIAATLHSLLIRCQRVDTRWRPPSNVVCCAMVSWGAVRVRGRRAQETLLPPTAGGCAGDGALWGAAI